MFSIIWNDSKVLEWPYLIQAAKVCVAIFLNYSFPQKIIPFFKVNKREWLWDPTSDKLLVALLAIVNFQLSYEQLKRFGSLKRKHKIMHSRGPSNINILIFGCSFAWNL